MYKYFAGLKFKVLKFMVSGGLNTALTYISYIYLLGFFSYKVSYSCAYIMGVFLSFFLNRYFVFKSSRGLKSVVAFPFIYVVQYLLGLFVIWIWVDVFKMDVIFGPLVVIITTLPVTYFLSSFIFGRA